MGRFHRHPAIQPVTRYARVTADGKAIVQEVAGDVVVREDVRDMRTFSREQQERMWIAAVRSDPRIAL